MKTGSIATSIRPALPSRDGLRKCPAIPCCTAAVAILLGGSVPGMTDEITDDGKRVPPNHGSVLALEPAGYWPADEGKGATLHDRSGHGNHGRIHSVPWRGGSLAFENDVYQWIQVPCRESYCRRSFSMGGWVFNALHKRKRAAESQESQFKFGALIIGQPFQQANGGKLKWEIWGDRLPAKGAMLRFGLPSENNLSEIEVISGSQNDAAGTRKAKVMLQSGKWQHVFYTYDQTGEARLYIDGELAHSANGVSYTPAETPFVFGGGRWGTYNLGGTVSMAGSLRSMAIFGRTLRREEIRELMAMTKPSGPPGEVAVSNEETHHMPDDQESLITMIKDELLDRDRRAEAVLKLAAMGKAASGALGVLADELERIERENGSHPPRIEEFLRNALLKALLSIDPTHERSEALLAEALIEPYFATLDLSRSYLDEPRVLIRKGRAMEALAKLKEHFGQVPPLPKLIGWGSAERAKQLDDIRPFLPLRPEYFDKYISKGIPFADAHYNAYNQIDTHDGATYLTLIERVPYQEVMDLFDRQLRSFAGKEPDPDGKWSRVKIVKIGSDGAMEQRVLAGDWFLFDARDAKMDGWAVALDRDGYIHLTGGQHNRPNQDNYVPGSWKKLAISEGTNRPQVMYWVSSAPGDIGSLVFTGQESNPRSVAGWMNYMNFARSPEGELFLYGRGRTWTWALLSYDANEKRWTEISGSAREMLRHAQAENPPWFGSLGETVPYHGPADGLVCAWQPGAYNFNRGWAGRALTFDRTGRMHIRMPILGVGEDGRLTSGPVYAYSDDSGRSFHAADGTPLLLPLTVNPIPSHNADMSNGPLKKRYDLWISLVREFGS